MVVIPNKKPHPRVKSASRVISNGYRWLLRRMELFLQEEKSVINAVFCVFWIKTVSVWPI